MKRFLILAAFLTPIAAFGSNCVVNMSHYDTMQPNFGAMKSQGVIGIIHEATYPRFDRDSYYGRRQQEATRAGLLWGAYHFGDATDPIRQADHFLSMVSSSWSNAGGSRPSGVLLVLDFEKMAIIREAQCVRTRRPRLSIGSGNEPEPIRASTAARIA